MPLQYLKKGLKNLEKRKEKFTIHRINPRETNSENLKILYVENYKL